MEVTTAVLHNQVDGTLFLCDALLIDGDLWLVPEWLVEIGGTRRKPKRAIRVPMADAQRVAHSLQYQWVVPHGVPKSALEGQWAEAAELGQFELVQAPDWYVPATQTPPARQ